MRTSKTEQGHTRVPSITFHFDLSKILSKVCGPTCKMVLARIQFRLNFNLIKKAFNNLPDTLQTHSRHLPDTIQKLSRPSKHLPGTFCYISLPLKDAVPKSQVTRRVVGGGGGGGGGLQVHNHATSWPNLQDGTCKNSIKIELQVGPGCGNSF